MAKVSELDYDGTPANNTDINSIGIQGTNLVSNFDNALRQLMSYRQAAITRYVAKTVGSYTAAKTDHAQLWHFTGTGASTLNLTAAATLTSGWCLFFRVGPNVTLTIDPNGAETMDGAATKVLTGNQFGCIICDGSNFFFLYLEASPAALNYQTGFLFGLTLSNNAGDATNDIDIAAGAARDGTDGDTMIGAAITKQLDAAWAVGTNAGGRDTGAIADGTWHVWLIKRVDTGVVDVLFSLSATAPTMPTNYTLKRRIGSVVRAAGALRAFKQDGDRFRWVTPVSTINATNPGTAAVTRVLSVPTGLVLWADIVVQVANVTTGQIFTLITALDETDRVPNAATGDLTLASGTTTGTGSQFAANILIKTDTSAQVRSRLSASGASDVLNITTFGWVDTRGKLA